MNDTDRKQLEALAQVMNSVKDYLFVNLMPSLQGTSDFFMLTVLKPIVYSNEGENLEPGAYLVGTKDLCVYSFEQSTRISEQLDFKVFEGKPIFKGIEKLKLASVIWAIYEYTPTEEIKRAIEAYTEASKGGVFEDIFKRAPLSEIKTYGLMNDKVNAQLIASEAFTQDTDGQMRLVWAVNQAGKSREPIATYISLLYEGTETKLSKKMTGYDNAVYNAVSTQFYYWKKEHPGEALYITPQELWRTMNGKDGFASPSAKQVEKTIKSIDKMRFTRFTMDIKAELEAGYISLDDERLVKGEFETYLLKADKVVFETEKGRKVEGYRITDEPILYTYNQAKKHILWVDYDLLNTSDKKSIGDDTIVYTNYLLQRIQNYIGGQLASNRILFESIYQATGIEAPESRIKLANCSSEDNYRASIRKAFKRDRDTIEAILTSWKDKGKLIKDFKPVKKGNAVIGYDLQILKPAKKIESKR